VKAIETGLRHGGSVALRRGTGGIPLDARPRMTYGEALDFNEALVGELMMLARSADEIVAEGALAALPTTLEGWARPAGIVTRMRDVVLWVVEDRAPISVAKLTGALRFVRARLVQDAARPDVPNADELRRGAAELEALLSQLERGNFRVRLKRWAGPWAWGDHEEDGQGRRGRDRWDEELHALGREAAEDPAGLTPKLREWLVSREAQRAYRFFYWLGVSDTSRRLLPTMEEWGKGTGGGPLASYLGGLATVDPAFVSVRLDELAAGGEVSGRTLVSATSSFPPNEAALTRAATLLREGRVDPEFVAGVLSGGRWVEPLTDTQFLGLLDAIAGPELDHAVPVVDFLGMWRHLGLLIEGPLEDFAWRCLESAPKVTPNDTYDFDQLAAALALGNPERAFRLLETLLTAPRERGSWRPTDGYREGEFWGVLRRLDRERALRLVFVVAARDEVARLEITWDLRESLDQVADQELLAALAREGKQQAELVSEVLTTAKPGFWPIALAVARNYPHEKRILANLEGGIEQTGSMFQGPWSAHLERCRAEVGEVLGRELVSPGVAKWLRGVEASLAKRAGAQLMAEAAEDVNEIRRIVENPAAPERLWAIRSLVIRKRTAVLRELLDPAELEEIIARLGLLATDRSRLRRQLGLQVKRRASQRGTRRKGRPRRRPSVQRRTPACQPASPGRRTIFRLNSRAAVLSRHRRRRELDSAARLAHQGTPENASASMMRMPLTSPRLSRSASALTM
jgi:hypothetical protein